MRPSERGPTAYAARRGRPTPVSPTTVMANLYPLAEAIPARILIAQATWSARAGNPSRPGNRHSAY